MLVSFFLGIFMREKISLNKIIISLFLTCIMFFTFFSPLVKTARAEEVTYSDVLYDLKKDEFFDESKYPVVKDDYSVSLITIAESNKNELFLYVYRPCKSFFDLPCLKVSISIGFSPNGEDLSPTLYNLDLVSSNPTKILSAFLETHCVAFPGNTLLSCTKYGI